MSTMLRAGCDDARAPCARSPCAAAPSSTTSHARAPPRRAASSSNFRSVSAVEVRVRRAERLADVVDRRDAHELDVGMDEQAADQLRAAVAAAADDGGLESLCHRGRGYAMPRAAMAQSLDAALAAVRASRRRDARADAQLGRDQQLHREHRGRERVGAMLREAFALPVADAAPSFPAATATATTWSGAPRRRGRADPARRPSRHRVPAGPLRGLARGRQPRAAPACST